VRINIPAIVQVMDLDVCEDGAGAEIIGGDSDSE
jgi:hypothetical protein